MIETKTVGLIRANPVVPVRLYGVTGAIRLWLRCNDHMVSLANPD
jgi:hypothetical protein